MSCARRLCTDHGDVVQYRVHPPRALLRWATSCVVEDKSKLDFLLDMLVVAPNVRVLTPVQWTTIGTSIGSVAYATRAPSPVCSPLLKYVFCVARVV